ncbi:MAG TPA: hypothetical protein VF941_21040 [Clostridia bacterium]
MLSDWFILIVGLIAVHAISIFILFKVSRKNILMFLPPAVSFIAGSAIYGYAEKVGGCDGMGIAFFSYCLFLASLISLIMAINLFVYKKAIINFRTKVVENHENWICPQCNQSNTGSVFECTKCGYNL